MNIKKQQENLQTFPYPLKEKISEGASNKPAIFPHPYKPGGVTGKGWLPGKSGNPKGRKKGQTLKEFARNYLLSLDKEDKIKFLSFLPPEIIWQMAEGRPHQTSSEENRLEFGDNLIALIKNANRQIK